MCIDQMMSLDGQGGTGDAGLLNTVPDTRPPGAAPSATSPSMSASSAPSPNSIAQYGPDTVVLLTPPPAVDGAGTKQEL